jgi:hypothetical protein
MAINITNPGAAGTHSFRRVSVNTEDNFLYFKNNDIPSALVDGGTFIYSDGTGSISGIGNSSLVYIFQETSQVLKLNATATSSEPVDLTGFTSGSITFNTPVVYETAINVGMSTPTNQAVKYFTAGDPITGLVSGNTYFLKNVEADFIGVQALYSITGNTHTFTTCGQTGRQGPTNSQIQSGYSTSWHGTYLTQGDFVGYQDWTVPISGVYQFEARGASGFEGTGSVTRTINQTSLTSNVATIRVTVAHGLAVGMSVVIAGATNTTYNGTYTITSVPSTTTFTYSRTNANIATAVSAGTATVAAAAGRGAIVRGRVELTKGEIITIAVGQSGSGPTTGTVWGGSGGGTFIVRKTGQEPLFVAGGGTADPNLGAGRDAVLTNNAGTSTGGAIGGVNGNGGLAFGGRSAAGGGFLSRGQTSSSSEPGGGSFLDGLTAAAISGRIGGAGGFGGAGNSDGNSSGQSGGAGGYSGGSGARNTTANHSGGGGGSYITPTATNVATSDGTYNTLTSFNDQAITNIGSFNTGEGSVVMSIVETFTTGNEVYPTAIDAQNDTNKIAIAPAGNSYHAIVPINYDSQNDVVHSAAAHGLNNGEAVTLTFNGTPPLGLSNETIYYVNTVSAYTYRLSSTPGPSFTTINLTVPSSRETTTSSKISRVIVNTSTETLTINNHGFLVNQPLKYDVGDGTPIIPLQDQVTYYVAEVVNANQIRLKVSLDAPLPINFTNAGTGTAHSFIFLTVNALEDTLYIPNHGLISGQTVRYSNGGGTTIPGLVNNQTYFIVKVDNSIVRLATNKALTNIANITDSGTGTQSLVVTSLDFANDIITVPQHGFLQGELIQYDSQGQTVVAGLTTATPYYVIFIDGDNIKLATTPENAEGGIAVDLQDSPTGVGRHKLQSLSKTPDGIYVISAVPSSDTFTVEARGTVPEITKIFNPRTAIDLNINAFFIPSHGFLTETAITYSQGDAATDISGLVNNTVYYAVAINRDYLRLATSVENAAAGITLDVDDYGTGVGHSFTTNQINGNITGGGSVSVAAGSVLVNGSGTSFSKILKVGDRFRLFPPNVTLSRTFADTNVNTTTNRIVFGSAHGFTTGDTVKFAAGGGVSPSPLVNEYYYFVRSQSSTEITLHNSASDATGNTGALDFTTTGTGSNFSVTRTTPVSPILRRITAVGSDTQITVDRPYSSEYTAVSYSYPTFLYVRPEGYSLHRPFDGGVEMSVGAKTSLGQIIRQTRKYFRYQSGKGLQTSAGINFQPSIDIESMERFSETSATCTTRRPHGLISGLFVVISQAEDSFGIPSQIYNGTFQVTVVNLTQFRISTSLPIPEGADARAYGFPQFYVREWQNGALRSGMFDFQNGMFFEFDGQKLYCVRRSSTQQMAGTVAAQQGSELIFGTGTKFTAQIDVGDFVVMRGQSYRVTQIDSDTRMSVRPEYKGSSGAEKEFNPTGVVNTTTDQFTIIGHGFSDLLPVVYNSIDGEPIGGLISGRTYYIDLVDNNNFKLLASPGAASNVDLSSLGTTTVHSFTPAKSGIIVTKTVDTRVAQEDWSIDPCDGSGPTGYNLDTSRIQMIYIDYSWYGAGKIRFGFKTNDGQVQYVHEFVHNNILYESYFRSGNLPARYEVITYDNPTYIPFLFHWGTSVMMDGRFDDDNAYLFTASSQTLDVPGTTAKSFSSSGIDLATDLFTVQTHGFRTGNRVQFQSIATNGLPGLNTQNPATRIVGSNTLAYLTNTETYGVFVNSPNLIHLTPATAKLNLGSSQVILSQQAGPLVTVTTTENHELVNGMYAGVYASNRVSNGPYEVTRLSDTEFTYTVGLGARVRVNISNTSLTTNVATVTTAIAHGYTVGETIVIAGATNTVYNGTYTVASVPTSNSLTFARTNANIGSAGSAGTVSISVPQGIDSGIAISEIIDFTSQGNIQYTYFLYPEGSLNNTSGLNYQPLISLRLSPSVSSGLTGKLGDRDVLNRMQLRLQEIGISSTQLVDVKLLLNPRLNNLNFIGVDPPSLTQIVEHTAADTVSGGVQVYNFKAEGGTNNNEATTTVDVSTLFELSNSILGGDSIFPDGPDIMTVAVSRLTGTDTLTSAKISWSEAQA